MFVVALTGGIGAGKSEASRMFAELGASIVDVDVISHQLTAKGQPVLGKIAALFGQDYLTKEGELDRIKMRETIFNRNEDKRKLEAILHPAIHAEAISQLNRHSSAPYQILAIPLFFESNRYTGLVNRSLLIDCDESQQVSRSLQRAGMTEAIVKSIIATQASRNYRRALATDIILNDGSIENLRALVKEKHEKFLKACVVSE